MILNNILIVILLGSCVIGIIIFFLRERKGIIDFDMEEDRYDINQLVTFIKEEFNDILKTNLYELNLSKEEFEKRVHNRKLLRKALKSCSYGDIKAKNYVKSFIRDILVNRYHINGQNINKIINMENVRELSVIDQFDILLFLYKKQYGYHGLEKLIEDNDLDQLKPLDEGMAYYITAEDIKEVYMNKGKRIVAFEDKLEIIVQRIYQRYKGYSVVDEIRDMKIDGVSGGVSGLSTTFYQDINESEAISSVKNLPYSYDSVWIFYKEKTINLRFLSFGSENELIRVCKNIYRYNNPGQLSESNGYKVNEMKDGSRIVVARPPFAESWVFFVRKFDSIKKTTIEELIVDQNNQLPIEMIKWLIKGCRVTAITGSQGSGKTTLLMSIVQFINPSFSLRIQEMSFELHLRKLYPFRNIVTFRETDNISGQEGLDLQKKTDGTVNILGEIATAPVSALMVQLAQVASLFTLFTHHAKTTDNLIIAIRNNLLQTGVFSNEKVAEQQVAEVINFDIHISKNTRGHRYIERITEIIPLNVYSSYPKDYKKEMNMNQKIDKFMDTMCTYFERVTDRKTFTTRDIIRFDSGKYIVVNKPTKRGLRQMKSYLTDEDKAQFDCFMTKSFGGLNYEV